MNVKKTLNITALVAVVASSLFFGEAALGLASVADAFKSKDYVAMADKIDVEKVSENYKVRFQSAGAKTGIPFAGLIAGMAVNPVLKAITSPEGLKALMAGDAKEKEQSESKLAVKSISLSKVLDRQIKVSLGSKDSEDELMQVTLDRAGFANWKITDIELKDLKQVY